MLTISKHIFILLSLTGLHPSNTFGGTVPQDFIRTSEESDIKPIKDHLKDINLKIDSWNGVTLKGKLVGSIYLNIIPQQSRLFEPNSKIDTKLDDNSLIDVRRQEVNRSSFNRKPDPDNSVETLRGIHEQISKLQILFNKIFVSKENNEFKSYSRNYDEHFYCIRNCYIESLPRTCSHATSVNSFKDGVYLLKEPQSDSKPFYVYCAHKNYEEKSWMIIQRREDGSVDFNRNWLDYKWGFGDLNGEYWIGLERLHQITSNRPHELWISLVDFEEGYRYAKYSEFVVGSEDEDYKLTVSGYDGDAGDSFKYHNSMKFSTIDKDNDMYFKNCARAYKGGWWYKVCSRCTLNGIYYSFANKNTSGGIEWGAWHGYRYSLRYVSMALRPREE